jgi:hypothetical protein
MCPTAKPESVFAFAHASCRIAPFRRHRMSEVCHCGGFLLAFAASQKCAAINRRELRNCCTNVKGQRKTGLCLNGAPSLLARCRNLRLFRSRSKGHRADLIAKTRQVAARRSQSSCPLVHNAECPQLADTVESRKSNGHAPASRNSRASVRRDEGPHGSDTLPDQKAPKVAAEKALSVLAYNLTRVMNIVGTKALMAAIVA